MEDLDQIKVQGGAPHSKESGKGLCISHSNSKMNVVGSAGTELWLLYYRDMGIAMTIHILYFDYNGSFAV
jgi:hypothetical protein